MPDTNPQPALPEEFTLADLRATLEPEEIAALSKATEDDSPVIVIDDPADDDNTPNADPLAEGVGQPAPEAQAQQPQPAPVLPTVEIPDTTEAERIIAELDAKLEALDEAYDNGEITRQERADRNKALIAEQARAQMLIEQANAAIVTQKQSAEQIFYAAQDAYYQAGAAALMEPAHLPHWDRHLRLVTGDAALQSLTADQLIRLAHKRYADEYEVINGKPLGIAIPGVAPAKLTTRTDPRPAAVQTLANVNGDLNEAISDSRFAQVDATSRTDPLGAEALMARMSPDELERYLQTA